MGAERDDGSEGLPETAIEVSAARRPAEGLARGATLGRYLVLDRLGAGGMGVVYAAYDPELDRRVALKVVRPGRASASADTRARMLREAQAIARLAHPNVIAVFDVGTVGGEVFLAMEFVVGEDLDEYVLHRGRDWDKLLPLLLQAGEGMGAAHAAGLVHRDFKPSNVRLGDDGRVRVLDFGLARAQDAGSDRPSAEEAATRSEVASSAGLLGSPLTRAGIVVGTPGFLAPELLEGSSADARSDQYSFCVTAWELLYGERPKPTEAPAGESATREEKNPGATGARKREDRVPRFIARALMRGLSADPAARFPDMPALLAALADDPSAGRRRLWSRLGAIVAVVAVAVGVWGWQRQHSALCKGSEQRLWGVWDSARKDRVHAAFLATDAPFAAAAWQTVAATFDDYTGGWVGQRTEACVATRLRGEQSEELLDLRMSCLDQRLAGVAALATVFEHADAGVVERAPQAVFGLTPLADCADVVGLRAVVKAPQDPAVRTRVESVRQQTTRAKALSSSGKYEDSLALAKTAAAAAAEIGYPPLTAEAQFELAFSSFKLGALTESAAAYEASLLAALAGHDDGLAIDAAANLAVRTGYDLAQPQEGERWARLSTALLARSGGDARRGGLVHTLLGVLAMGQGQFQRAVAEQREALRLREQGLGPNDPDVGRTLTNLAAALLQSGENAAAVPYLERALRIKEATLGSEHPDLASSLTNLAVALSNIGRSADAIGYAERALDLNERYHGAESAQVSLGLSNLSSFYKEVGRYPEALTAARRALGLAFKSKGHDSPGTGSAYATLGDAQLALSDASAAEASYREALLIQEKVSGVRHPETAFALTGLARALLRRGRAAQAAAAARRAVAIRSQPDIGAAFLAESRFVLAQALWQMGEHATAKALAEQARQVLLSEHEFPEQLQEVETWLARVGH